MKCTSRELGQLLFDYCLKNTDSFLQSLKQHKDKYPGFLKSTDEDIDETELLIAIMWSVVDLMQEQRFQDALSVMHGAYMRELELSKKQADKEIEYLSKRYEEYRKIFRNQKEPNYSVVAHEIAKNISKSGIAGANPLFQTMIVIHLQEYIIQLGKMLTEMQIVD